MVQIPISGDFEVFLLLASNLVYFWPPNILLLFQFFNICGDFYCASLFEMQRNRQRDLLSASSLPKCTQGSWPGQAPSLDPRPDPGHWLQLLPRVLTSAHTLDLNAGTPTWDGCHCHTPRLSSWYRRWPLRTHVPGALDKNMHSVVFG